MKQWNLGEVTRPPKASTDLNDGHSLTCTLISSAAKDRSPFRNTQAERLKRRAQVPQGQQWEGTTSGPNQPGRSTSVCSHTHMGTPIALNSGSSGDTAQCCPAQRACSGNVHTPELITSQGSDLFSMDMWQVFWVPGINDRTVLVLGKL